MVVRPDMTCCRPLRELADLECRAGIMAICLGRECAKLPSLEVRRRFADQVAAVKVLADPAMQEAFRAEVKRCYVARKTPA
jgi:hypothetical protein